MTALSCPVCHQPVDDSTPASGEIVYCPSCAHRLKFKAGGFVNLGIDVSGTRPLSSAVAVADPAPPRTESDRQENVIETQEPVQDPAPTDEELVRQSLSTVRHGGGSGRARHNARLNARRHQQSAVMWLLAATIFVALGVGYLVMVGPERFTNIYRPRQLAGQEAELNDPAAASPAGTTADPPARLAADTFDQRDPVTGRRQPIDSSRSTDAKRTSIFTTPTVPDHYPTIKTSPLYASPWRAPFEPLLPYDGLTQISLQNESILSETLGRKRYVADLVYDGQYTIDALTLRLGLVDPQGQVIATMQQPLGLVNYAQPQRINVTIPPSYAAQASSVIWSADVGRKMGGAVPIGHVSVRPTGSGEGTALMVVAVNPVNLPLTKASFLFVAHNNDGQPVMRWRMDWSERVEAGQAFYFKAVTPVQSVWGARHWVATGVAIPGPPATSAN